MNYFHHHADNYIVIRTEAGIYLDTIDNFISDLEEPYPGIPAGYIGRYYEPGVNHYFYTSNAAFPQELKWDDGDHYIAAYDKLITAKAQRENLQLEG